MFIVRPAKVNDAKAVLAVCSRARLRAYAGLIPKARLSDFKASTAVTKANIAWWQAKIQKSITDPTKRVTKVAVIGDKVVGFCSAAIKGDTLHITNLYVDPSHQGQGIGGRLLGASLSESTCPHTTLHVLVDNQPTVEFYKKQGFVVSAESDITFYGAKRYRMQR